MIQLKNRQGKVVFEFSPENPGDETIGNALRAASVLKVSGIYIADEDLAGQCFDDCRFPSIHFVRCKLADCSFERAELQYAVFEECNLSGVDFYCASLTNAHFASNTEMNYVRFSKAMGLGDLFDLILGGYPDGYQAFAWCHKTKGLMLEVGCQSEPIKYAREHWPGERDHENYNENRQEVAAFVEYAERCAKARGWEIEPKPEPRCEACGQVLPKPAEESDDIIVCD